jgi:hypothetical protein
MFNYFGMFHLCNILVLCTPEHVKKVICLAIAAKGKLITVQYYTLIIR